MQATVVAALTATALAGAGPAVSAHRDETAVPHTGSAPAGTISTVAGGVGGPGKATTVGLSLPCGVAFGAGHVYVGDFNSVRTVSPGTDRLTTPAGTGVDGPLGDGGSAAKASLLQTCGVATDHSGNLVIADLFDGRVRVVAKRTGTFYGRAMTARHIYTVAGTGHRGFHGDGGPATKATLGPASVVLDGTGNLVIGDAANFRIRVVAAKTGTFYGQAMTAGDIYTVAGSGPRGPGGTCTFRGDGGPATSAKMCDVRGISLDATGNLVFSDSSVGRVRVVAEKTGTFYGRAMTAGDIYTIAGGGDGGDGGPATSAGLIMPMGVTLDASGNVLIGDSGDNRVRVVAEKTGTFYGRAMTAGDIYTVAGTGTAGFSGDGGRATRAELSTPAGVTLDAAGNMLIADSRNRRVRVVAAKSGLFYGRAMSAGDIYTVAGNGVVAQCGPGTGLFSGDGGPATHAELNSPRGLAVDAAGNTLVADTCSQRIRVTAARNGTFYGQAMTAGDIYTVAGNGKQGNSGDGGPATKASLDSPGGVGVDASGNLLIADTLNNMVRVVAGRTGTFYGKAMTAGAIYEVAGDGTAGFSGDDGPATSAEINAPFGVAVDAAGNVLIADLGNNRIRAVAASTGTFYGQAMTAGDIYTIAGDGTDTFSGDGGPATSAGLSVEHVAVDAAGNLLVADDFNNRIRVVAGSTGTFYGQAMTAGDIYTIAGDGSPGFSGDGGPATSAALSLPVDVSVDASGNAVIDDFDNDRIRVVAESTGTFYGVAMTAGDIYTVAGSGAIGVEGFSGDGGPATKAELSFVFGVAVDSTGDLLISDTGNGRIRMVTG